MLIFWQLTEELELFCFLVDRYLAIRYYSYLLLLMSGEDGAVPGPSGLESSDSSHSGTHPRLAPEDIQQIAGVVAGMLRGSSASPLSLPPASSMRT